MRRTRTLLMGELLEEFFAQPRIAARVAEGHLPEVWRLAVGDAAADCTTELRLQGTMLHVRLTSSVLRAELFMRRRELAAELNRRLGHALIRTVMIR